MNLKPFRALAALGLAAGALAGAAQAQPAQCANPADTAMQCTKPHTVGARPPVGSSVYRYGIDFAWTKPSAATVVGMGARFAASYYSYDSSKDWSLGAVRDFQAHGIGVVGVWETTADRSLTGFAGGVSDARQANANANADGLAGHPIYFAVDFQPAGWQLVGPIRSYFQGVQSVLGHNRTGSYGGIDTVRYLFDQGIARYGWQTSAWSGGQWDSRAQLQQYAYPSWYDWDRAMTADYGQQAAGPQPPSPQPRPSPSPSLAFALVKQGDTGRNPAAVQYLLNARGLPVTVDGIDGPATTGTVQAFQRTAGLAADGLVGPLTWSALIVTVQQGNMGPAVAGAQTELNAHGSRLTIDGADGPATTSAMQAFQKRSKLAADGIAGPLTWSTLTR